MATKRRVRRYGSPFPLYTFEYIEAVNWTVMLNGVSGLGMLFVLASFRWQGLIPVALPIGIVLMIVGAVRYRRRMRREVCDRVGHDPYKPIPEVAEWKCWRCGDDLEWPADRVDMTVREAAQDIASVYFGPKSKRRESQAKYSDRR